MLMLTFKQTTVQYPDLDEEYNAGQVNAEVEEELDIEVNEREP